MIVIQGKIPRKVGVACSGGVDSMTIVDFLSRKHDITLYFFHHGTKTSTEAYEFLQSYVKKKPRLTLKVGYLNEEKPAKESLEEFWRNKRYQWLHSQDETIITGHHLGDSTETWIWSSMHGQGKIIPYRNRNVIRPFRLNHKSEFINWCCRHDVPWIEDNSNHDTRFMRNYIRKELVEKCLIVNPGLFKVIRKKVEEDYNNYKNK
jgi:tRNA(Ile)-lysidine synthase